MKNAALSPTTKKNVNLIGLAKRVALQFMQTVSGTLGHHIEDYHSSVWYHEIAKAHELLGNWQSPLPTTLQLLRLAGSYRDDAENAPDLVVKLVLVRTSEMLRILGTSPSAARAAELIDRCHLALVDALEPLGDKWYVQFRTQRVHAVKKLIAVLP